MVCSDWRQRLRMASFRGAQFWVEADSFEGGRRLHIHEFPNKEFPYNEDLGQQARRYQVTAYVVGDQADAAARGLISACTSPGPASLVLPIFGGIRANCQDIATDRSKDRHGFVAFRILFIEAGPGTFSGTSSIQQARAIEVAAKSTRDRIAVAHSVVYRGLRVADFINVSSTETVRDFAAALDAARVAVPRDGELDAEAARAVQDLYDDAPDLVETGVVGDRFGDREFVAESAVSDVPVTDLPEQAFDAVEAVRLAAMSADDIAGELAELSQYGVDLDPVPLTTFNRQRESENRESLLAVFRRSALANWAIALTQRTYANRREAIQARADAAEIFAAEIERTTGAHEWEVLLALHELAGTVAEYLSGLMATLQPIVIVEGQRLMPSVYWAYRLYGDATQAEDLWNRNEVKHPAFMPTEFEALAP